MKRLLITGINSDIGSAFAHYLMANNDVSIDGTYREDSEKVEKLTSAGCKLIKVDFSARGNVDFFCQNTDFGVYDAIYFMHGSLNPIGKFSRVSFDDWEQNVYLNSTSILRTLSASIPNLKLGCRIITLAGGGVNGATENFSAYTMSKIALIKMTELLAAEYPDLFFFNLGPGFVDTAIHQQTINAEKDAGPAYKETLRRYRDNEFVPMEKVIDALTYFLADAPASFSGRNFSAAQDILASEKLFNLLSQDANAFKLRRASNNYLLE